jgi:hypothetical protein
MTPFTLARIAFAASGVIVFGIGIRIQQPAMRWTGIGLLVAALMLRFAQRRRDN